MKKILIHTLLLAVLFLGATSPVRAEFRVLTSSYSEDIRAPQEGALNHINPAPPAYPWEGYEETRLKVYIPIPEASPGNPVPLKGVRLQIHDHDEGATFQILGYTQDAAGNIIDISDLAPHRQEDDEGDTNRPKEKMDTAGRGEDCGSNGGWLDRYHPVHASSDPDQSYCYKYHPVTTIDASGGTNHLSEDFNFLLNDFGRYWYDTRDDKASYQPRALNGIILEIRGGSLTDEFKRQNMHYHIGQIEWLADPGGPTPEIKNLQCTSTCVDPNNPTDTDEKIHTTWEGGSGSIIMNIAPGTSPDWDINNGYFWNLPNITGQSYDIVASQFTGWAGALNQPLVLQVGNSYSMYVHDPAIEQNAGPVTCDLELCDECNSTCTTNAQCQAINPNYTCYSTASLGNRCRLSDDPATVVNESSSPTCVICDQPCTENAQCPLGLECNPASSSCRLPTNLPSITCEDPVGSFASSFTHDCDPERPQAEGQLSYGYTITYSNETLCNLNYSEVFFGFTPSSSNAPIRTFLGEPTYENDDGWFGYRINDPTFGPNGVVNRNEFTSNGSSRLTYSNKLDNTATIGDSGMTIQNLYDEINNKIDDGIPIQDEIQLGANTRCIIPLFNGGTSGFDNWIDNNIGTMYLNDSHRLRCPGGGEEDDKISGHFYVTPSSDSPCDADGLTPINFYSSSTVSSNPPPDPVGSMTAQSGGDGYIFSTTSDDTHDIRLQLSSSSGYACTFCNRSSPSNCEISAEAGDDNADFFIFNAAASAEPWWQAWGGLVYGHNSLYSNLPTYSDACATSGSCEPYLIRAVTGNEKTAGIPASSQTILSAITGWITQHPGNGINPPYAEEADMKTNVTPEKFTYFAEKADLHGVDEIHTPITKVSDGSDIPPGTARGSDNTLVSKYTGTELLVNPDTTWTITDKRVIFVENNLRFRENGDSQLIRVESGGFLAFVVGGDVIIEGNVGNSDLASTSNIEAVIVADRQILVRSSNKRLVVEGSYVGWDGIQLERAFDDNEDHLTIPTEVFVHRPDFVTNSPDIFKSTTLNWKEVN